MNKRDISKQQTHALLLRTAESLFDERGVEETTTREIARAAGVGVGTVFAHFPDKAALIEALLVDRIDGALLRAGASLPEGDLVAELTHVARELYATYAERPALSRALVAHALFLSGAQRPSTAQLARFQIWVFERLQSAKLRGEPVGDFEQDFFVFFSLYFGLLIAGLRGEIPLERQHLLLEGALRRWFGGRS